MTGSTNTCSASTVADPTRRKRSKLNETNLDPIDIAGPAIQGLFQINFKFFLPKDSGRPKSESAKRPSAVDS